MKFENMHKMDKFLEKYNLLKLNEEEAESLNRPVTPDEIETVIKKPWTRWFHRRSFQNFKGRANPYSSETFQKSKKREDSQTLFTKPATS